jgi:nitroreductase
MDLDKEKQIIDTIRRCQRNWDHSKCIPEEHINHWIYIATNAPSKQDVSYYNLYCITDKEKIQLLLDHTWGHTLQIAPGVLRGIVRNPQVAANVCFLFAFKMPAVNRQTHQNGKKYDQTGKDQLTITMHGHVAIGIASGLVAQSAATLGYKTGFNSCFGQKDFANNKILKSELGISGDETIILALGIGYPQEGRQRYEHNETEFLVGPYPNSKYSINDPYVEVDGVKYPTPKIHYKTYSQMKRNIKVIKI